MAPIKTIPELISEVSPYYKAMKKKNGDKDYCDGINKIVYDSSSETLEPLYFYILDTMNDLGLAPEKLIDNFSSTPGSGHFAELGQRATVMQQQATKILGDVNTVMRSVLNLVYDLKDFKMRLQYYDSLNSKDEKERDAATLSLKQIWMDKVDMTKGNSSIKAMALGQTGFQTLIDAFLFVKDEKTAADVDLNDRVKRILIPRIQEFNIWAKESEKELRKRYQLERTYLKSQVNSLTLYSRWAKPYLKAAQDLEAKDSGLNPALVKAFNTIILELTLLGKNKLDIADEAVKGNLPLEFSKAQFIDKVKKKRMYYSCVLVEFMFRGIPQKVGQQSHYAFGGRAEITMRAYALNDTEIAKLKQELNKSDLTDVLKLIDGMTKESLDQLQADINEFLEDKSVDEKKEEAKKEDSNPFLALFGAYDKSSKKPEEKKKDKKEEEIGEIEKDDWIEKNQLRRLASENAKKSAFDMFDNYKKAHAMPSYT